MSSNPSSIPNTTSCGGLRDLNGRGVLAGLTHVSEVRATKLVDGELVPDYGQLVYRGYDIKDLVKGLL